jgi:hypothetical protein
MSLRLRFLFDRLFRSGSLRTVTSPAPRFRPQLEVFEERTVPASLSGNVWVDANANGTRDEGEAAAVGVTVEVYDLDVQLGTDPGEAHKTTTDANGNYTFADLTGDDWYTLFFSPTPTSAPVHTLTVELTNPTGTAMADAGVVLPTATSTSSSAWFDLGWHLATLAETADEQQFVLDTFVEAAPPDVVASGPAPYQNVRNGFGGGFGQSVQVAPNGTLILPTPQGELFTDLSWLNALTDKPFSVIRAINSRQGPLTANEVDVLRSILNGAVNDFVLPNEPQIVSVSTAWVLRRAAASKLAEAGPVGAFWSSPATVSAALATLPTLSGFVRVPLRMPIYLGMTSLSLPSTYMFGGASGGTPVPQTVAQVQQQVAPLIAALGSNVAAERDQATNQLLHLLASSAVYRDRQAFLTIREALKTAATESPDPEVRARAERLLPFLAWLK